MHCVINSISRMLLNSCAHYLLPSIDSQIHVSCSSCRIVFTDGALALDDPRLADEPPLRFGLVVFENVMSPAFCKQYKSY